MGKDVLLLHGYMSCKESFYYQIKFLSESGFRVTAPDFIGFGKSAQPDCAYSVTDYALWLKNLIDKLALNNAHIVAHSFGARVAIKLLSQGFYTADKLVLTGGAGIVKQRSLQYIWRVKTYRAVKKVFPRFAEKRFGSDEYKQLSPIMKDGFKKIVNEDLQSNASLITNKTLLIYGANDSVTPPHEEGEIFNKLIKNSRLIVTDGGHFCFSEYPDCFNKLLLEFFTED